MTGLLYWSINSFLYCKNCNLQKIVALKMIFFLNNFNSFKYCNGLSILRINESWGSIYLTATHFFPSWIMSMQNQRIYSLKTDTTIHMTWCHFYVSSEIFFYTPDQSCFKDDLFCISFIIKYTLRFLLQSPHPMKLFLLQSPHPMKLWFPFRP